LGSTEHKAFCYVVFSSLLLPHPSWALIPSSTPYSWKPSALTVRRCQLQRNSEETGFCLNDVVSTETIEIVWPASVVAVFLYVCEKLLSLLKYGHLYTHRRPSFQWPWHVWISLACF
jgi:hypothetical protein